LLKRYLCPRRNRGSVLIFSIWILVFFSILSVAVFGIINSQAKLVSNIESRIICCQLARAAVYYAQDQIKKKTESYASLYDLGQERKIDLGLGSFSFNITDEESKLDLNFFSAVQIALLPGLNTELAEEIINSPLRPFKATEELLAVDGITEDIFTEIKGFITVYSGGKININTAPKEVLKAFGLDDIVAESIIDYRKASDDLEGTGDDRVFENPGQIIEKLNDFRGLSIPQVAQLTQLISQGIMITDSKVCTLNINTQIIGKQQMKYAIVIDEKSIKQWREW